MRNPHRQVVADITTTVAGTTAGEVFRRFTRPLIRLLAQGQPVTLDELARAAGAPRTDVERGLRAVPDVERDAAGRVVGFGLTLRPTEHALQIGGRTLYAWCALDALVIAAALEQSVVIESPEPATGAPIRAELAADRVLTVEPAETVVSWVGRRRPDELVALRATSCRHIRFFSSPAAGAGWQSAHPEGSLISVAAAYAAARHLASAFFAEPRPDHRGAAA
jgi:alkylmercury lyase